MNNLSPDRLPNLRFGLFEEDVLPIPCAESEVDGYNAAIWHPLPMVVDSRITSDLSIGIVRSWNQNGPAKAKLAYLQVTHLDMERKPKTGEFIVHHELARDVMEISQDLFAAAFPIEQERLIDYWDADDERSMSDNNSSALCVRAITSGTTLSNHALGRALDINTKFNPYHNCAKGIVAPAVGDKFLDRSRNVPGMIHDGDAVVKAFESRGWEWGGRWRDPIDYQHFQKPLKG